MIGEFPCFNAAISAETPEYRRTEPYAPISATRMDWHLIRAEKAA